MKSAVKTIMLSIAAVTALCTSQVASAATYTYEFTWSGDNPYGAPPAQPSTARAFATVVVDMPSVDGLFSMDRIKSLSMTVQGTRTGDGLYTKSDYHDFYVAYRQAPVLEFQQRYELSSFEVYGVAFFSNGRGAPNNVAIDTMVSGPSGALGDMLYLTSEHVTWTGRVAPVPEPETYAMLMAGLGLIAYAARKRRGGAA
ncbi:hypothetical protein ASF61_12550 [Duganella sp. Leaf126]|uniref:PEP-CTERM sorting domain-containing protein n=1 Tax=Duganella sp. Leaf126 TaxID=1736266 RepID=UPI0006F6514D|nr:PEP-CTERM sorting domain-containing protein [Duganella sp. Leaf126]KQQ32922.1 hypothetical protein ASF61_12550 [Duganella sp. Leaf126]